MEKFDCYGCTSYQPKYFYCYEAWCPVADIYSGKKLCPKSRLDEIKNNEKTLTTSYDYYKAMANLDLLLAKIRVKMRCTTSLKFYSQIKTFIAYINYKSDVYECRFSLFEATQMTELDIGLLSVQIFRELQDGV